MSWFLISDHNVLISHHYVEIQAIDIINYDFFSSPHINLVVDVLSGIWYTTYVVHRRISGDIFIFILECEMRRLSMLIHKTDTLVNPGLFVDLIVPTESLFNLT